MYKSNENSPQLHHGQTTISHGKQPNHADWIQLLGFDGRIPIFGVKSDMFIYQEERRNIRQINDSAACPIFTPALQVENPNQQMGQVKVYLPSVPTPSHLIHDHDYCAKPTHNGSSNASVEKHGDDDHTYCRTKVLHLTESSVADENQEHSHVLSEVDNPNRKSDEQTQIEVEDIEDETIRNQDETNSFSLVSGCDYILPDVARNLSCSCRHNCNATEIALLKTQLEQKSIALNACLSKIDSLKEELGTAKEHISNLRAQLEENTHTLCAYLTMTNANNSHGCEQ